MSNLTLSKISINYLNIFGTMLKNARLANGFTQQDLSIRLNCSRQTIAKIEHGDPKISIGSYFEASYVLGIPLFVENENDLKKLDSNINLINSLLPTRVKKKKI